MMFYSATDPPDAPFILPIFFSDIGERWMKVRWYTTADPQSPLRYFTLQLNRNGQGWQVYSSHVHHSTRSLKVEGLLPGETYIFRIMATNDRGNSPYSAASTPTTTRLAREYIQSETHEIYQFQNGEHENLIIWRLFTFFLKIRTSTCSSFIAFTNLQILPREE